jgi:hypothetical protein
MDDRTTRRRSAAVWKVAPLAACVCALLCGTALAQNITGDEAGVNGVRASFEIDNFGVLFCGDGPLSTGPPQTDCFGAEASLEAADDWAEGSGCNFVLELNASGEVVAVSPHRAAFQRDDNWGNKGDKKDRTQFGGTANKNNDNIASGEETWSWNGTGGGPQKNDITNSYFLTRFDENPASPTFGERWIFLGAETRATNGDSHIDFEYNQAGVFICEQDPDDFFNDCVNSTGVEPFLSANDDGAIIGLGEAAGRTVGDFIISLDFVQGGKAPLSSFRQWTEIEPGEFEFVQIDTDCEFMVTATNFETVTHTGGWDHFEGDGTPTEDIIPFQFVEVGFCLDCLASEEINVCLTNATFQVKTRSSQSFTAELKDLVLVPFPLEPPPECEIDGPPEVCPRDTGITYTVTETTGVGASFEWAIMGDATFCGGGTVATGESVCVDVKPTAACPSSFELWVTAVTAAGHRR